MAPVVSHLHLVPDPAAKPPVATTKLPAGKPRRTGRPDRKPLGQILIDMRAVEPGDMLKAIALRDREEARLGDILLTHGWVSEADLMAALSLQWGARALDLVAHPPDARLLDGLGAAFCLKHGALPWRQIGGATVLATSRPEEFAQLRNSLPEDYGPVIMALAPERDLHTALVAARETTLIRKAETRVPEAESCRSQNINRAHRIAITALAMLVAGAVIVPLQTYLALALWAVLSTVAFTGLKFACFLAESRAQRRAPPPLPPRPMARLPIVSVMVPLFREDDIAPRLIRRIGRIDYPKELLDILIVVEEDDHQTRTALERRGLPRWMRVVTVPDGPIRTKPRALNYALDFCRGSIVGIWDAEDRPEAQQIRKVVRGFYEAAPDVACLQGILDFYNARHNWLTRCFTVEYASWFRAFLPGLARLGFVVPLGGTTLFFRREVLEKLGGWDAHNVTEDADLGVRLARHGYRTDLIDTVTEEEPNSHAVTWIRQRSRWQKGFAVTWASHMRDPARLWRELGAKRFWGVQILFVGSLSQAVLTPVLWSFWLITLGLPTPLNDVLPPMLLLSVGLLFVSAEAINIAVGIWATRGPAHRHLQKWVPTLHVYFPLAALSSYKALYEWITRPFYWDKTAHGVVAAQQDIGAMLPAYLLTDPVHVPADLPPSVQLHSDRSADSRLHLFSIGDNGHTQPYSIVAEPRADFASASPQRPALALLPSAPEATYLLLSPLPGTAHRTGIELQPGLEGAGDM
ncbi:glycosyltransferase [Defluviimonas sp. WL0050]|uniref:Glycosyltransferase n=1 Tax=Albidovulum litorale TaxID=2984134 RepID=A0ABT2ZQC9_9RHOB|nr:glycosyltransferase [Defluviimonas sp. WL0050]MCV2873369.1 glycosyltransferase [Defluviimonas sp. WL0050]